MNGELEPLGIPSVGIEYFKLNSNQNIIQEFLDTQDFLEDVISSKTLQEFQGKPKMLQFINYGDTQLVYVLSVSNRKYTLLLGQPATEFGTVKKEYNNLKSISKINSENVVTPMQYFKNGKENRELYVTPYIYQSRCIACDDENWGVYVPEPNYHFKQFSDQERSVINSCMIALLVRLYDDKNKVGIASCKIGGGDFMLDKGYENQPLTYENILQNMKLIAARELIPMEFDEYTNRIREEFSKRTYYKNENERDKSILINHKCRIPMSEQEIENGIKLGMILRNKDKQLQK